MYHHFAGATRDVGQQQGKLLCAGIRTLQGDRTGHPLGPLTLAAGIAGFLLHGDSGDLVRQAAGMALY
jgi:hypothetical protein